MGRSLSPGDSSAETCYLEKKNSEIMLMQELNEFQIAGDDGEFFDAVAVIAGSSLVVSCDKVAKPTQVRFGWHKVANPNLVNSDGLPASPFQTQGWRGMLDAAE